MARNPVQFQKGISLSVFLSLYGTEDQCFDALYQPASCINFYPSTRSPHNT